jgi:hypothetical protein
MRSRPRRSLLGWPFLLAVLLAAVPARPADRSLEYAVKATFLYKFAFFVDWPPGSFARDSSPFDLCVVGPDPYGGRIQDAVAGQSVGKHPIVLHRLAKAEPGFHCHAMFVSGSDREQAEEALHAVRGTPTLTVTDSGAGNAAGIIHFVIVDDRVSFDIDKAAATRNHLVISSKLLALARRVNANPAGNPE